MLSNVEYSVLVATRDRVFSLVLIALLINTIRKQNSKSEFPLKDIEEAIRNLVNRGLLEAIGDDSYINHEESQ